MCDLPASPLTFTQSPVDVVGGLHLSFLICTHQLANVGRYLPASCVVSHIGLPTLDMLSYIVCSLHTTVYQCQICPSPITGGLHIVQLTSFVDWLHQLWLMRVIHLLSSTNILYRLFPANNNQATSCIACPYCLWPKQWSVDLGCGLLLLTLSCTQSSSDV